MRDIYPGNDYIDPRTVLEQADEVQDEIVGFQNEIFDLENEITELKGRDLETDDAEERDSIEDEIADVESRIYQLNDEIANIEEDNRDLLELADMINNYNIEDELVCDDIFVEYAQRLATDIGAISDDMSWPADHIDWNGAADALKMDYSSLDFSGYTYWYRY